MLQPFPLILASAMLILLLPQILLPPPTLLLPPTLQYKRTGRWEAHIWDSSSGPSGKGRQLHLGSFLTPYQAAR
jgi:hypothetical protein